MKRKKKSQAALTESLIMTAQEFAKLRGLDPSVLEQEAVDYRFGTVVSGLCTIDVIRYDKWVSKQIQSGGVNINKSVSRKSLTQVINPGILNATITRLTDQLKKDGADLEWLNSQVSKSPNGIEKKQLRVKKQRLEKKIDKKKTLIGVAEDRLNHLLDAELGEAEQPE